MTQYSCSSSMVTCRISNNLFCCDISNYSKMSCRITVIYYSSLFIVVQQSIFQCFNMRWTASGRTEKTVHAQLMLRHRSLWASVTDPSSVHDELLECHFHPEDGAVALLRQPVCEGVALLNTVGLQQVWWHCDDTNLTILHQRSAWEQYI